MEFLYFCVFHISLPSRLYRFIISQSAAVSGIPSVLQFFFTCDKLNYSSRKKKKKKCLISRAFGITLSAFYERPFFFKERIYLRDIFEVYIQEFLWSLK